MIDFRLNDHAEIELLQFGEERTDFIWERCYPALRAVLYSDDAVESGVEVGDPFAATPTSPPPLEPGEQARMTERACNAAAQGDFCLAGFMSWPSSLRIVAFEAQEERGSNLCFTSRVDRTCGYTQKLLN